MSQPETPTHPVVCELGDDAISLLGAALHRGDTNWGDVTRDLIQNHGIPADKVAEALLSELLPDECAMAVAEAAFRDYVARRFSPEGVFEGTTPRYRRLRACRAELLPVLRKHGIMAWRVLERIPEHEVPRSEWVNIGLSVGLPHEALRALVLFRSNLPRTTLEKMLVGILGVPGALHHFEARDMAEHLVDHPARPYSLPLAVRTRIAAFLRAADSAPAGK